MRTWRDAAKGFHLTGVLARRKMNATKIEWVAGNFTATFRRGRHNTPHSLRSLHGTPMRFHLVGGGGAL